MKLWFAECFLTLSLLMESLMMMIIKNNNFRNYGNTLHVKKIRGIMKGMHNTPCFINSLHVGHGETGYDEGGGCRSRVLLSNCTPLCSDSSSNSAPLVDMNCILQESSFSFCILEHCDNIFTTSVYVS